MHKVGSGESVESGKQVNGRRYKQATRNTNA